MATLEELAALEEEQQLSRANADGDANMGEAEDPIDAEILRSSADDLMTRTRLL